jgi:hypothetical protein
LKKWKPTTLHRGARTGKPCWKIARCFAKTTTEENQEYKNTHLKTKPQKQNGGLKVDMEFDDFMRRLVRVKPSKKSARRKK